MIELITLKDGTTAAVLKRDTHVSKWERDTGLLCHDLTVYKHITPLLRPGDFVVDAGANIGDHTIAYANCVGPEGRVLAFEPCGGTFACLAVNLRDWPNTKLFNCGLGRTMSAAFLDIDPDNIGASHVATNVLNTGGTPITILPLDMVGLPRLDFLKLDVEGFEMQVLLGGVRTISTYRPKVFCELNHGALHRQGANAMDIVNFFGGLGYEMQFLDPAHNMEMPQIDVLFLPKPQ